MVLSATTLIAGLVVLLLGLGVGSTPARQQDGPRLVPDTPK